MRKYCLVILLAMLGLCFLAGYYVGEGYKRQYVYSDPITVEEAGEILARSAWTHQYYIDNPVDDDLILRKGMYLTPAEFHEGCVERYNQVWDLIQRLDDVKP